MEEALAWYKRVLEVRTRHVAPLDWARRLLNMGGEYTSRLHSSNADIVEQAVVCCKRALQVWTREVAAQDWAKTENNLGNMYIQVCARLMMPLLRS